MHYDQFDYFAILFLLGGIALGIVGVLRSPQQIKPANSIKAIAGGILIFFLGILESRSLHQWNPNAILSLICLKKISATDAEHHSRFIVSVSYLFVMMGIMQLLCFKSKSNVQDSSINDTSEIQKKLNRDAEKEYANARFDSIVLQYAMILTLFFIAPLGLLYFLVQLLIISEYVVTGTLILMSAVVCICWFGLLVLFFFLKKYWVFKVMTNNSGITHVGLLRKITARWDQIISIKTKETNTGNYLGKEMIEVETRNGRFYFPFTMKERGLLYPKLDLLGENWIDSDGNKKLTDEDNCSLYVEIKERLSKI